MDDSTHLSPSLNDSTAVELTGKIMVVAIIILFLVVVFVLFLHLYAKWFWWRMEENTVPSREARNPRRRRFVFTPGQDPAVAGTLRRGLEPSILRSLPVLVFHPEDFKDGLECAVCLSELAQGEKARLLPKCNHGFHVECIEMWFQSHSTCPLCRNPVALDCSNAADSAKDSHSPDENLTNSGGEYSTESLNFPTNVLFWGNQTQVSSRGACLDLEEGPSQQPPCPSSSSMTPVSSSPEGMLVIDIPRQMMTENLSATSPSGIRLAEEELKSPMTTRLRSLKRLLSKEKRVFSCSSSCVEVVEQVGRGQSS